MAEIAEDAADAVHWAYYDRLKFLSNSIKPEGDDDDGGADDTAESSSAIAANEYNTNGTSGVKVYQPSKRRKAAESAAVAINITNDLDNELHMVAGQSLVPPQPPVNTGSGSLLEATSYSFASPTNAAQATATSTAHLNQSTANNISNFEQAATDLPTTKDSDEYGIGKYVGKILQGLDEDLVDELVSQVVRDCLEVRHKQRLRHIEYYHKHNSQGGQWTKKKRAPPHNTVWQLKVFSECQIVMNWLFIIIIIDKISLEKYKF